jgi:hypothetical protein
MDHSSIIYLMESDGKLVTMIQYQDKDDTALAKLINLMAPATSQTQSGPSKLEMLLHFAMWI